MKSRIVSALLFLIYALVVFVGCSPAFAVERVEAALTETPAVVEAPVEPAATTKHWYDKLSLRGYTQMRYNRLLETNDQLKCQQCDASLGENGGFFFRRARLVVSGDVADRLWIYIQPDLVVDAFGGNSTAPANQHFLQMRDLYFDLALDSAKEFRIRFGQSKVPFGFDNLQSSSHRIALDRSDALNSAVAGERDLGVVFYWAPAEIRKRFKMLADSGLKGSGDYGVIGLGVFDGQTANRPEANDSRMVVGRFTYPVQLSNGQIFEAGIQGMMQEYKVTSLTAVTMSPAFAKNFEDKRVAASFIWYPQPIGFQFEAVTGVTPSYQRGSASIKSASLVGGYLQTMALLHVNGDQILLPYARYQVYRGGKKHELDARHHNVEEFEFGTEWTPFKALELTAAYVISARTTEDNAAPFNQQQGNLLRLQAQVNY